MVTTSTEVFSRERQELIANLVAERGRARVGDLARNFGVSVVTIRKDLVTLEREGRLVRAYGGAIAPGGIRPDVLSEGAFSVRERHPAKKELIGRIAADLVSDGESIAFDASTTALSVARRLRLAGRGRTSQCSPMVFASHRSSPG